MWKSNERKGSIGSKAGKAGLLPGEPRKESKAGKAGLLAAAWGTKERNTGKAGLLAAAWGWSQR
jgi:hypothetical protein